MEYNYLLTQARQQSLYHCSIVYLGTLVGLAQLHSASFPKPLVTCLHHNYILKLFLFLQLSTLVPTQLM